MGKQWPNAKVQILYQLCVPFHMMVPVTILENKAMLEQESWNIKKQTIEQGCASDMDKKNITKWCTFNETFKCLR